MAYVDRADGATGGSYSLGLAAGLRTVSIVAAVVVAVTGVVVLVCGWVLGHDPVSALLPDEVTMKANTAAGLVFCAVSLLILTRDRRGQRLGRALAGTAIALGALTLVEYASGWSLGIDQLLFYEDPSAAMSQPPGRMGLQTAIAFILIGTAILTLDRRPQGHWLAGAIAAVIGTAGAITLLGHLYGLASLYAIPPYTATAVHTAACFLLLAVAIGFARPERGWTAILIGDTPGGLIARSLLPPALVVPPILGALVLSAQQSGHLNDGEGVWLLVVSTGLGCTAFAISMAKSLQPLDAVRRRAEDRLREQERSYQSLVEQLPLVLYADAIDEANTPLFVSPQIESMLGYTPAEWLGDPGLFERIVHPEDRAPVLEAIARMRETGEPFRAEYRLRAKDGREVWVLDETVRLDGPQGQPLYAQGYMLETTDRKAAEEETRQLEGQLNQAQKLESIGQLAGGVAHDFNNMLGAITAYVGFAEQKALDHPEIAKELAQIRNAAERGAELTDQLLVFSRKDMIRPQLIDLGRTIEDTRTLVHPLLVDDVLLRFDLPDSPRHVWADPMQIKRILLNLMLNARAAMPAGGVVRVSLLDGDGTHDGGPGLARCYHALAVADNGEGMDPEVAARAFEPFFTTKPKGEGTGLGLAIVYGIAKRLEGSVKIDSQPGSGTTVTVTLPAAELEDVVRSQPVSVPSVEGQGEVVLVVDDDDALRSSTARILSEHGYAVLEARDGTEGLELYRQADSPPDVVVTDVVMPRMGGIELAAALARSAPGPSVVLMSGYAEDLAEVDEHVPLVTKPFKADVLLNAVSEALTTRPQTVGATGNR